MELTDSLRLLAPELVLSGALTLVLIADLVWRGERREGLLWLALGGLAATAAATYMVSGGASQSLFSGMIVLDPFASFFKYLSLGATALVLLFSLHAKATTRDNVGELAVLSLAICLGMMLMAAATDLVMIYLAVEVASVAGYILAGLRRDSRQSAESALKYIIYGGVASGIMVYGMSLLYGLAGSTNLLELQAAVGKGMPSLTLLLGVALVFAGIGFKIASVPFHMWCPDVYAGAPTPVTALLSVGPKAAGFAILIRFFFGVFVEPGSWSGQELIARTDVPWPMLIAVLSIVTMTVGNLSALAQTNLKRFMAYSSIAHAGYLLMGVAAASMAGLQATLVYLAVYLFMNLGAFLVIIALESGQGITDVEGARGLAYKAPWLAVSMAVFLFSLTGIPPFAGFIGKLYLFSALLAKGGTMLYVLAIIGVLNSVVSLYFYARILRAMFLEQPATAAPVSSPALYRYLLAGLAIPIVVFGLYWQPLDDAVKASLQGVFGG